MKARVKATGEIVEVFREAVIGGDGYAFYTQDRDRYLFNDLDFVIMENYGGEKKIVELRNPDYWTRLKHQYAGMAMQGLLSNPSITENKLITREGIVEDAERLAHALVKKVRYEENPKELEGLKKELEALKIEKTILENKIKLLKEERK